MSTTHLITTIDFCTYHKLEQTFITELHDAGLIEITVVNQTPCIPETELDKLERITRLHTDLDINIAGIEAITHLLQRIDDMHEEMRILRNSLKAYE